MIQLDDHSKKYAWIIRENLGQNKKRRFTRMVQSLVGSPKFRIIYVDDGSPCHWQIQKRVNWLLWDNVFYSFSSATTAGNEVVKLMEANDMVSGGAHDIT